MPPALGGLPVQLSLLRASLLPQDAPAVPGALCGPGVQSVPVSLLSDVHLQPDVHSVPDVLPEPGVLLTVLSPEPVCPQLQDVHHVARVQGVPVSLRPDVHHVPDVRLLLPVPGGLPAVPDGPAAVRDDCPGSCCCFWNSAGGSQMPDFSFSVLQLLLLLPGLPHDLPLCSLSQELSFLPSERLHGGSRRPHCPRSCSYDS